YPFLGILLSFLLWNWHPAKIFMGDAGSTYLGAIYAGIILKSGNLIELISLILILLPLIADPITCLVKRIFYRQPIFIAHNLHLYQRLNQYGMHTKKVCLIYLTATSVLCLAYLYLNFVFLSILSLIIILIGYFLDKNYALAFEK
ncbi:glycosyl transferase, partial [Prochlorococcus sp. AH-716-F13]|nr:glycosyl transferase [Prochlorococcus sp. AH-716-F13]